MTLRNATDDEVILQNLRNYSHIEKKLTWISKRIKKRMPDHPLLTLLVTHKPWQQTYLASIDANLKVLEGTPNLSQVTERMENGDQFFDELSSVRLAASYKKSGFSVDFIPEAKGKKRPDFLIKKDRNAAQCIFEVKHIAGTTTLDVLMEDVRKVVSAYNVDIETEKFQLDTQSRQLASKVISILEELQEKDIHPPDDAPHVVKVGNSIVKFRTKSSRKIAETGVEMRWPNSEDFKDTARRLSSLIESAKDQLLAYMPKEVNVIALDVDKASLHQDEVKDTVRSMPGLFKLEEYRDIMGVKFISNVIPPVDVLLANSNNQHVKNRVLQTLSLSPTLEVITWPSTPLASLPISDERRQKVLTELNEEFAARAIGRKLLKSTDLGNNPSRIAGGEFRKIVINEIMDKIWFVDDPPDVDAEHSVHGIGAHYGAAMAEAETRAVIGKLTEASSLPELSYKETLNPEALDAGVRILKDNGFNPTVVLTGIHDFSNLWQFKGFVRATTADALVKTNSGSEIPILNANEIPDNTTLLVDGDAVGTLVLKQDVTAVISEISEEEKPGILQALPDLKAEQLKEKARVLVEEVFRVDIDEPKAMLRMKREPA